MLPRPECHKRHCKHFIGIKQDDEDESTERVVCAAFPDGIPHEIAFGTNKHLEPYPGDNGIQYERESPSR